MAEEGAGSLRNDCLAEGNAHDVGMFASDALHVINRPAFLNEWVPRNYFCRAELAELARENCALEIDLGCGDGSFLVGMAGHYPEREFLGVERLLGRVQKVCRKISRQELHNVRVLRLESRYALEWLLPRGAISRIHLLCPDPWPKARHCGRRLIQQSFLQAVHLALLPAGEFLFMTDHQGYYEWAIEQAQESGRFDQLDWNEESFFYPKTDFQIHWESQGKSMWRLRLRRRDAN